MRLVAIPILLLAIISVMVAQHQHKPRRPQRLTSRRHVRREVRSVEGNSNSWSSLVRGNGYGVGRNGDGVGRRLNGFREKRSDVTSKVNDVIIPELMEGDVNLPDVLYNSILALKKVTGAKLIDLSENGASKITSKLGQKAVKNLRHGFGYVTIDLETYEYHLSFVRQRHLPKATRPWRCTGCFPTKFKPIISPQGTCQGSKPITLMILITTIPKEREERMALRETWLKEARARTGSVRYLFLIGNGWTEPQMNALKQESQTYKDFLLDDYVDSYYNLPQKVVSGFRWAVDHCSRAQFVVRTAADNYLHLQRIQQYITKNRDELDNVQIGRCIGKTKVNRTPWARHYQTLNDYPQSEYMPYCIGTTFLLSMPATKKILQRATNVPYFNIEDIWVGLVMAQAGVGIRNVMGFNVQYYPSPDVRQYLSWRQEQGVCKFDPNMLSLHRVTPSDIRTIHKKCMLQKPTAQTAMAQKTMYQKLATQRPTPQKRMLNKSRSKRSMPQNPMLPKSKSQSKMIKKAMPRRRK